MYFKLILLLFSISNALCDIQMCDKYNSVDITEGIPLLNGVIHFNGVAYKKNQYYVDDENRTRGCECRGQKCVRKCCPRGFGYFTKGKMCVSINDTFEAPVWDLYRLLEGVKATQLFHFVPGVVNCTLPERRIRAASTKEHFHMRSDGKLFINMRSSIPPWSVQDADHYCIDTFVEEDPYTGARTTRLDALFCFPEDQDDHNFIASSSCMLISCVFILATVGVYAWLPELRNLHGRVLMAYLLCLFVGFAFLATMQILLRINNINGNACIAFTFIIYFTLESAFFWLNVMCFDIWWTFSGKRGLSLERLSIRARFAAYSAYAFGIPTVLTILLASLEFSGLPLHPLLPMLRHQGCFLYGNSRLLYLYGPIVVLCVMNVVFFILTAVKIAQIKRQTSMLKSKESSMHDQQNNDRQRFLLYVKLFAVMGINWILEVISAIYPEADYIFRFIDAYNVLIGLIIFIIFVCKRKIFRLIKKRLGYKMQSASDSRSERSGEGPRPELKYKQLRGGPMSRTQTTTSIRTLSIRDDMVLGSIRNK